MKVSTFNTRVHSITEGIKSDERCSMMFFVLFSFSMTLSQTERGYAPPVEHIRNPNIIKEEMG